MAFCNGICRNGISNSIYTERIPLSFPEAREAIDRTSIGGGASLKRREIFIYGIIYLYYLSCAGGISTLAHLDRLRKMHAQKNEVLFPMLRELHSPLAFLLN